MNAYDTALLDVLDQPAMAPHAVVPRPIVELSWLPAIGRGPLAVTVTLAAVLLATSFYRLNHTDLWTHLNFGRWIVENGQLPVVDPVRPPAVAGTAYATTAWLSQVLAYFCHSVAGAEGLPLAHVSLVVATSALVMWAVRAQGLAVGWVVAAAAASYILALPVVGTIRPQLIGVVCFAAVLAGLAQSTTRRIASLWVPLVFVLWANAHGSFAVGLLLLACWCVGTSVDAWRASGSWRAALTDPQARRAWSLAIASTIATCVNPYGPRLLVEVAGFSGHATLADISEWQPLVIGSLSGGLFFGSLAITAVLLRLSPRPIRFHEVLCLVAFGLLALTAIRMLAWWALVWPWVVAPHCAAVWRRQVSAAGLREASAPTTTRTLASIAFVFVALVWAPPTHALVTGTWRQEAELVSGDTPVFLADEVQWRQLAGRLFAPMDWGDYLAWHTRGALRPVVNNSVHLITPPVWRDYRTVTEGRSAWRAVLDHYRIQYLVVSRERSPELLSAVLADQRSRILYQDQKAVLAELLPVENVVNEPGHGAGMGRIQETGAKSANSEI